MYYVYVYSNTVDCIEKKKQSLVGTDLSIFSNINSRNPIIHTKMMF